MEKKNSFQTGLSDSCIFLGGQPRSGTTLLSSMLRNSKDHFQGFEMHIRKPSFVVGLDGRYTKNIFSQLGLPREEFDHILQDCDVSKMNLGAWVGPKEDVSAEPLTGKETDNFQEELYARGQLVGNLMRKVAQNHNKKSWGFKILGDIIFADYYAAVWPKAKFIFLLRDPRDQAMSILKLNEQRIERNQQLFYQDYREAAIGWKNTVVEGRKILRRNSIPFIELKYEDLVSNADSQLSKLSDFLDIDLEGCMSFQGEEFVDSHLSRFKHHENLKKPVNTNSVCKWRSKLSDDIIQVFIDEAGTVMQELDYPLR